MLGRFAVDVLLADVDDLVEPVANCSNERTGSMDSVSSPMSPIGLLGSSGSSLMNLFCDAWPMFM